MGTVSCFGVVVVRTSTFGHDWLSHRRDTTHDRTRIHLIFILYDVRYNYVRWWIGGNSCHTTRRGGCSRSCGHRNRMTIPMIDLSFVIEIGYIWTIGWIAYGSNHWSCSDPHLCLVIEIRYNIRICWCMSWWWWWWFRCPIPAVGRIDGSCCILDDWYSTIPTGFYVNIIDSGVCCTAITIRTLVVIIIIIIIILI